MSPAWMDAWPGLPVFLVLIGLALGSFLNVVIHRLPLGLSLWGPGSRCPDCKTPIRPLDNIPVVSFLVLRGRCRSCTHRISARYPAVEILGAACVILAAWLSPDPAAAAVRAAFLLAMLAVTFIDLDHRIIPDVITLPGTVIGLLVAPVIGVGRVDALLGVLCGAGFFLLIGGLYRLVRKREGLGGGDVKLGALMGAFLGWPGTLLAIFLGSLAGTAVALALLRTGRVTGRTALPYGTFLAPAAGLAMLFGKNVLQWYTGLL